MKKILGLMKKCITKHDMIKDGDKIGVGVSGGKDSMVLLKALSLYRFYGEVDFELEAFTVDIGFDGFDFSKIEAFCKDINVPFHVKHTNIKDVVFDIKQEKNPCSLCAHMRRGAINNIVKERGFNKLALGHHADDLIDTFFMTTLYQGQFYKLSPVSYLDRQDITIIRPMLYVPEKYILSAIDRLEIPVVENPCTADGNTKRAETNEILQRIYEEVPGSREKIFTALLKEYKDL